MTIDKTAQSGIKRAPEYRDAVDCVRSQLKSKSPRPILVTGLCEGATDAFFASLSDELHENKLVFFLPSERDCARYEKIFSSLGYRVYIYPYRDFIFHDITASKEFEHRRLSVLSALLDGEADIILSTPDAATQFTMPPETLRSSNLTLHANEEYDLAQTEETLSNMGYVRHDPVDGTGQFSVRGGILDIYSVSEGDPVRIEFFGDEIDSMSYFDPLSQRRTEAAEKYTVLPAGEIPPSSGAREKITEAIKKILKSKKVKDNEELTELYRAELSSVESDAELRFSDKYINSVYEKPATLFDYLDNDTVIIVNEYTKLHGIMRAYQLRMTEECKSLVAAGLSPALAKFNIADDEFDELCDLHACLNVNAFLSNVGNRPLSGLFTIQSRHIQNYAGKAALFEEDIKNYISLSFETVVITDNKKAKENLEEILRDKSVPLSPEPKKGAVCVIYGRPHTGYELPDARFVLLNLRSDITDERRGGVVRARRRRSKRADAGERIMSYADITEGDYVVHETHGIGRYLGITQMTLEGVTKDFLKIQYHGTDMLYIPCDNLENLSKYIGVGAEDGNVKLSRLGGGEWEKAKQRASEGAKEMAKKLIALYAERMRRPGYAFPPDDDMQLQFESDFIFDETDGQLDAVDEIKKDMMAPHPMDRLLCGDVGFGKTEVALRAAFKAANAGKQTAILAPTTLLAMQHYNTLISRMRAYPVNCAMISRMVTPKKQAEILRALKRGEIDIIVGTHRLISSDIEFKDLGLLIVDEEQRFGVAQKEKLKETAKDADVLTLTATPIPRTLNMAMSGVRDMSILEEAPGDRLPVQTYVMEYDENVIVEALRRELSRGGQAFYLYNRVDSINRKAQRLSELLPDARIAVAHGKMDKDDLSDLWQQLIMGEIDIMVCTTIIETGVDIPNANTLIIENADRMGLSQLHQIRGRVGRSPRRAYAYFTFPRGKMISEESSKRLSAIREYTEFGSGFKVALRDLEIRGAGNILGAEQHGHIASVGYDMYMKILNEAILTEEGKMPEKKEVCAVDLGVSANLPEDYIPSGGQRIDIYRKISLITNEEDTRDITDELIDRYGDPPKQAMNLLNISLIRATGERLGFSRIENRYGGIIFRAKKVNFIAWTKVASEPELRGRILINASNNPYVSLKVKKGEDIPVKVLEVMNLFEKAEKETEEKEEKEEGEKE